LEALQAVRKVVSEGVVYEWVIVELTVHTNSRIKNDAKENHCKLIEGSFQFLSSMTRHPLKYDRA
jgi:hypothetical protein